MPRISSYERAERASAPGHIRARIETATSGSALRVDATQSDALAAAGQSLWPPAGRSYWPPTGLRATGRLRLPWS